MVRLYLIGGLTSSLCMAYSLDHGQHGLGASGAAFTLGAYATCRFPQKNMLLFGFVPMRFWQLSALLMICDMLYAFSNKSLYLQSVIAHESHIGGVVVGTSAFFMRKLLLKR